MENNIIRLPFGRRMPPETTSSKESMPGSASLSDFELFRLSDPNFLITVITLTMLIWKDGLMCLSFQVNPARREWLKKHQEKLRDAFFGQIETISTNDLKRTWEVDSGSPIWLEFPDEHPERFRVGLIVSEVSAKVDGSGSFKLWKESIILALRRNSAKK